MGLRSASHHSVAAFLSSVAQTEPLVNDILASFPDRIPVDVPFTHFCNFAGTPDLTFDNLKSKSSSQNSLSHMTDSNTQKLLLENSPNPQTSARLRSVTLPHSGSRLNVVPFQTLSLSLLPTHFQIASRYRLGLPVYPFSITSYPVCTKVTHLEIIPLSAQQNMNAYHVTTSCVTQSLTKLSKPAVPPRRSSMA
jgi:hypothetical protein